jgi:hypothetical protein
MFRVRTLSENYKTPSGAFIVLCNHQSFADFLFVMLKLYPHRLNAVVARKYFYYKLLHKLLPIMGCIPKNLFDPDTGAIAGMVSVIKRGDSLLLFPEGRGSTHGSYMGMHVATGKLIKMFKVPIVACHINGAYLCMPFWRKGFRRGRINLTITNLLSADEIQNLKAEEINHLIDDFLSGKASKFADKPPQVFRAKKLVEGLENILYLCPACQQEFTLNTSGNVICCTACDTAAAMDKNGALLLVAGDAWPGTVSAWFDWQVRYETKNLMTIADSGEFKEDIINDRVIVRMPHTPGQGLKECGGGTVRLNKDGWHYEGVLSDERVSLFFPLATVPAVPFDPKDNFQIYSNGLYVFTPIENPQTCVKYAVLGECAYRCFVSDIKMTRGL